MTKVVMHTQKFGSVVSSGLKQSCYSGIPTFIGVGEGIEKIQRATSRKSRKYLDAILAYVQERDLNFKVMERICFRFDDGRYSSLDFRSWGALMSAIHNSRGLSPSCQCDWY